MGGWLNNAFFLIVQGHNRVKIDILLHVSECNREVVCKSLSCILYSHADGKRDPIRIELSH